MQLYKCLYLLISLAAFWVWYGLNRHLALGALGQEHWRETTGRVIRLGRDGESDDDAPVVNFYIEGRAVRGTPAFLGAGKEPLKVGAPVSILYDPDSPNRFLLKDYAQGQVRMGMLFYAGLLLLVCFFSTHYSSVF